MDGKLTDDEVYLAAHKAHAMAGTTLPDRFSLELAYSYHATYMAHTVPSGVVEHIVGDGKTATQFTWWYCGAKYGTKMESHHPPNWSSTAWQTLLDRNAEHVSQCYRRTRAHVLMESYYPKLFALLKADGFLH